MNGWDVAITVITLSVSSVVAFRIAKLTTKSEELKDRRRHRDDTLVAIGELFAQSHTDLEHEFVLRMSERDMQEISDEKTRQAALTEFCVSFKGPLIETSRRTKAALSTVRIKLMMLNATESLAALREYVDYLNTSLRSAAKHEITNDQITNNTVPELRRLAKQFEVALAAEASETLRL